MKLDEVPKCKLASGSSSPSPGGDWGMMFLSFKYVATPWVKDATPSIMARSLFMVLVEIIYPPLN
jgi:hypothetical protein